MPQRRPIEFWRKIRVLVEKGLSLNQAAKEFGCSFSHLRARARMEGWRLTYTDGRGSPRTMDYADGTRRVELARVEAQRDAKQAELLLEARVAVFDTKRAELVAQKILAQHSTMMKVALSELVVQTAQDLRSPEIRPKDKAQALAALKSVSNQLYGWDKEVDIQSMERAGTSYADLLAEAPNNAVNLALSATTPEQLRQIADAQLAKERREPSKLEANPNQHNQPGPSASECNGPCVGPSPVAPEQPRPATHGRPSPEKEAPLPPLSNQKDQLPPADRPPLEGNPPQSQQVNRAAPLGVPQPAAPPTPGSPAWHKQRLQDLDQKKREWRRWH